MIILTDTENKNVKGQKDKNNEDRKRSEIKNINIIGVQKEQKQNNGTELIFKMTIQKTFLK